MSLADREAVDDCRSVVVPGDKTIVSWCAKQITEWAGDHDAVGANFDAREVTVAKLNAGASAALLFEFCGNPPVGALPFGERPRCRIPPLMATVHTNFPKHAGELNFAKQLASIEDPKLHLWFGIDFLPGVTDIDCLLWHEDIGVFVIEVKAVPLSMVREFGLNTCHIEDRAGTKTPQRQAYDAQLRLREYLKPRTRKIPFIVSTVCWPRISRAAWRHKWQGNREIAETLGNSMLFDEDVFGSLETFRSVLARIYKQPPIRIGSNTFAHDAKQLQDLIDILDSRATPTPIPSDLEKLRIIEKDVEKQAKKEAQPRGASRIIYSGGPGTGKTFRLLRIGWHHAQAGCRVLYACFNKVLAADIRRIAKQSQRLKLSTGFLEARDVFDIMRTYVSKKGHAIGMGEYDEWGQLLLEEMRESPKSIEQFDTILIDESQDMMNWALSMLELHGTAQTTVCVASGQGQHLYPGDGGAWLDMFRRRAESKMLRRNFRNTKPVFQMAQLFYEAKLDRSRIHDIVRKFLQVSATGQQIMEFARPEGTIPSIVWLDDTELEDADDENFEFGELQRRCMVREYSRVIQEQIERLEGDQRPIDLLILVPSISGMEVLWARAALSEQNIPFTDYTVEENRRDVADQNAVRLSTFHSARGVEGIRVLVFGMENIQGLAEQSKADFANLGYIVLSRAIFECVIAIRRLRRSPVVDFLLDATERLVPQK